MEQRAPRHSQGRMTLSVSLNVHCTFLQKGQLIFLYAYMAVWLMCLAIYVDLGKLHRCSVPSEKGSCKPPVSILYFEKPMRVNIRQQLLDGA